MKRLLFFWKKCLEQKQVFFLGATPKIYLGVLLVNTILFLSCASSDKEEVPISRQSGLVDTLLTRLHSGELSTEQKIDSLQVLYKKLSNGIPREAPVISYAAIADEVLILKDYPLYKEISREIIRVSSIQNDTVHLAAGYDNLGRYFFYQEKQIDSAYTNFYKASTLYETLGNNLEAGKALLSMAIMQKRARDYVGGEASSIRAIELFEPLKNNRFLGSAYNNLGLIQKDLNRPQKAVDYFRKAQFCRQQLVKNNRQLAGSYNNIGLAYVNWGKYDSAIKNYNKGLAVDSLYFKSTTTYARLLDNKAFARLLSGDKNVLALLKESLALRDSIGDVSGSSTSNYHLGFYYNVVGDQKNAALYAGRALQSSNASQNYKGTLETLALLADVMPPEEAIIYSKRYIAISDSLLSVERSFQDYFARTRFETDELLVKTDKLEIEAGKATRLIERLKYVVAFIVFSFLLFYIWRQRRLRKKELSFQAIQQEANEEIYRLLLEQRTKIEEGKRIAQRRISEELHDNILSKLFGIRLSLDSLNNGQGADVAKTRASYLEELQKLSQEIRSVSHDLSNTQFVENDSYPQIVETLVVDSCKPVGLSYTFDYDGTIVWEDVTDVVKVHVYRMLQEAIMNVIKHAAADTVTISFTRDNNHIVVRIADDGEGFDASKIKGGIGFKNMKSRVTKISGKQQITSSSKKGTEIIISFPQKK